MAKSLKELREQRAAILPRMKELRDKITAENRPMTAEERTNWEAVNKDYDTVSEQIKLAERFDAVEAEQRETAGDRREQLPGREDRDTREEHRDDDELTDEELGIAARDVKPEVHALALQGWMRRVTGLPVEERHAKAARIAGLDIRRGYLDIALSRKAPRPAEGRALSTSDAAAGGSTCPPGFVSNFEQAMLAFGGVRNVAEIIRTDNGNPMTWPTANDTGNEGTILGESATVSEQDVSTGGRTWHAYKYTSKLVKVPIELLEDSAFDLASNLGGMLGERIARAENRYCTTGTGAAQPVGIVVASTLGVTAASATAITADEIYGLVHSVDPSYRTGAGFMFHDNVLLAIRKLKDGNGQYLWQAALTNSEPDRLLGYAYTINQHMASSIAASAKSMLFGDLKKYKVREVRGLRLRRLVERYADADQEGFVAFMRGDGGLLEAGVAPVKHLIQAA